MAEMCRRRPVGKIILPSRMCMHVDGISILFSSFFILPFAFLVDFMINLAIFLQIILCHFICHFFKSRLPQNLYRVTKVSPK